jgi:hypothetical protein
MALLEIPVSLCHGVLHVLVHLCHVSSRTGRVLRVFHTDYHWDRLHSYYRTSPPSLAALLLSCDVSCDV